MPPFDAATIQVDAVLAQQFDVELVAVDGSGGVFGESRLDVGEGDVRSNLVDLAEPGHRFLKPVAAPLREREADVLDAVTTRTQGDQADQLLDPQAVVVSPDLMALNRVRRPCAIADLAAVLGGEECSSLQRKPGGRADVGADVAIPATTWHEFDA